MISLIFFMLISYSRGIKCRMSARNVPWTKLAQYLLWLGKPCAGIRGTAKEVSRLLNHTEWLKALLPVVSSSIIMLLSHLLINCLQFATVMAAVVVLLESAVTRHVLAVAREASIPTIVTHAKIFESAIAVLKDVPTIPTRFGCLIEYNEFIINLSSELFLINYCLKN